MYVDCGVGTKCVEVNVQPISLDWKSVTVQKKDIPPVKPAAPFALYQVISRPSWAID